MSTGRSRLVLQLLGSLALLLGLLPPVAHARDPVSVVLRYDDYSSFQTDPRVIAFEQALFEGVQRLGGNLIVGVIPFPAVRHPEVMPSGGVLPLPLGEDKRQLLRRFAEAGVLTVAIHGFNHGNNRLMADTASEFAGLPEAKQALLLATARDSLLAATGLAAKVFVPPFNQYDAATLRAMASTGFEVLSAGRSGPSLDHSPVLMLPSATHPARMRRAVESALSEASASAVVTVTLHPYDFIDTGQPMPGFRIGGAQIQLSDWLNDLRNVVSMTGVRLASLKQLRDEAEDLSAARFRANESLRFGPAARFRLLPESLRLYAADGVYYSADRARDLGQFQFAALMIIAATTLAASSLATRAVRRRLLPVAYRVRLASMGVSLVTLLAVAAGVYAGGVNFLVMPALIGCAGLLLGSFGNPRRGWFTRILGLPYLPTRREGES